MSKDKTAPAVILVGYKGGAGSGHWGHAGRVGKVGGSVDAGTALSIRTGKDRVERQAAAKALRKNEGMFAPGSAPGDAAMPGNWQVYAPGLKFLDDQVHRPFLNAVADTKLQDEMNIEVRRYSFVDGADAGVNWARPGYSTRETAKDNIVIELTHDMNAKGHDVMYDDINEAVGQWAHSSNDNDMRSLSMQVAAHNELGIPMSQWQQDNINKMVENTRAYLKDGDGLSYDYNLKNLPTQYQVNAHNSKTVNYMDVAQSTGAITQSQQQGFVRSMYNNTQSWFSDRGYKPDDTVTLYRGVKYDAFLDFTPNDIGKTMNWEGNAMESWSISARTAASFAGGQSGGVVAMNVPVKSIISTFLTGIGCMTEGEVVIAGAVSGSQVTYMGTDYQMAASAVGVK